MAKILTTEQVAEKLQVTVVTVRGYLIKGMIPGRKIGKQWRINEDDFDQFVATGFPVKEEPTDLKK